MADTYVSSDQFDEFVKRIEQGFAHAEEARVQEIALMNQRFKMVEKRFEMVEKRLEQVDQRFEQVNQRFAHVDRNFEHVDRRFAQLDQRLDEFKTDLRADIQNLRIWVIGLFGPMLFALVTAVIKWIFFTPAP